MCKNADSPYFEGKREMIKWKHRRSVDCVVGGYREHKDGGKIGSLLLGLYNAAGELHFIGHCSGFSDHDRVELLKQFEQLRSEESFGFEARMPGGESRWSAGKDLAWTAVQPGVVVDGIANVEFLDQAVNNWLPCHAGRKVKHYSSGDIHFIITPSLNCSITPLVILSKPKNL